MIEHTDNAGATVRFMLIRHGETPAQLTPERICGRSIDMPLTERGIAQAKKLGQYFSRNSLIPTEVYSSPALRAIDTARWSLGELGVGDALSLQVSDSLSEQGFGTAEGKLRKDVYTDVVKRQVEEQGKNFKLPGGESMNEVGLRVHCWLLETLQGVRPAQHDQLLFVYTHAGAITNLLSQLQNLSRGEARELQRTVLNASVTNIDAMPDGRLLIGDIARIPHLLEHED